MKSRVIVHERPSMIERLFSKVLNNCELVYVPPKRKPKKDPYEGLDDKEIIAKLKEENRSLKRRIYELESDLNTAACFATTYGFDHMPG